MIRDLILKNRSYRRFAQSEGIDRETLRELVDLARMSPSGANAQPLKYMLCAEPERNALVFQHLAWAGYLKDWPGPEQGERPAAYIVILGDTRLKPEFGVDPGIAAQSILLGAVERGLGGCILASIKRQELARDLDIPEHFQILLVIALGVPVEAGQAGSDGSGWGYKVLAR
jgi:nitroreductase